MLQISQDKMKFTLSRLNKWNCQNCQESYKVIWQRRKYGSYAAEGEKRMGIQLKALSHSSEYWRESTETKV